MLPIIQIEDHIIPPDWGIYPVLFNIGNFEVPSYSVFVSLALLVGGLIYYLESKKIGENNERSFYIVFASLIGGTLGAKVLDWIVNAEYIIANFPDPSVILSGRTIVGGLIGGMIGVKIVKSKLKITERKGNLFAPSVAIGLAIGRIGCFLRGCCYGIETNLPWGINFGDDIFRHPTQIYESIFSFLLFIYFMRINKESIPPGKLFDIFCNAYFLYRFFSEFIRAHERAFFGLTIYQIFSLVALIFLNRHKIILLMRKTKLLQFKPPERSGPVR
jgi:phosphatidylglycerol:prolipoprotein diacylglycerol transferase